MSSKKNPEIRNDPFFEQKLKDVEAWIEVMDMKRKGEIDTIRDVDGKEKFDLNEVRKLSLKYGIPESEVLDWLREIKYPSLLDRVASKSTADVSEVDTQQYLTGQVSNDESILFKIRQWEIRSFKDLVDVIGDHLPGIMERTDFPILLKNAELHIQLLLLMRNRTDITRADVISYAVSLHLNKNTAMKWVFDGEMPLLHKVMERALTMEEAAEIIEKYRVLLSGIMNTADVLKHLNNMYPNSEYNQSPQFPKRWGAVVEFFKFLDTFQKGGTIKGIAKRANVSSRRVREWVKLRLPWLLRHVLPSIGQGQDSFVYRSTITEPLIHGRRVKTFKQLLKIIEKDYPWLFERKDHPRLIDNARAFFKLIKKLKGKQSLLKQDISHLGKELGVSHETVRSWAMSVAQPMVFDIIKRGLSIKEAEALYSRFLLQLKGVDSFVAYKQRIKTLYLYTQLFTRGFHTKELKRVRQFFKFLKALKKGGLHTDIARRSNLPLARVKTWVRTLVLPRYLSYASSVPVQKPLRGHRWLPLIVRQNRLDDFIQVPLKVRHSKDILNVLKQLNPLQNSKMKRYEKQFGTLTPAIAFMYLLGSIVSDGGFGSNTGLTTRVSLSASKKYSWAKLFGHAFCFCLGLLGISSERWKNQFRTEESGTTVELMVWGSASTTLLEWIRHQLLGLTKFQPKSDFQIDAKWILEMPMKWKVAFLQGVADGDGWASVRAHRTGIGSKVNPQFFKDLLDTVDIKMRTLDGGIEASKRNEIKKLAELPLFRYSTGRLGRLRELVDIFSQMKYKRIKDDEESLILTMHSDGYTTGEIASIIWAEHGFARRPSTIRGFLKRKGFL